MSNQHTGLAERLWSKVTKGADAECWPWTGRIGSQRSNYGRINVGGRQAMAHRVAWELTNGPIADEMTVDHLCRNTLCVNPSHMEIVTRGENSRRNMLSSTHCKQGHAFDEENTRIHKGRRNCRTCHRGWSAAHKKKLSASHHAQSAQRTEGG